VVLGACKLALSLVKKLTNSEVAQLIQRFLERRTLYPQEWNDFVETSQSDRRIEAYRKRCYFLDPRVNRPGEPDPEAVAELRSMIKRLRSESTPAQ
jgi:hypothetical protein